MRRAVIRVMCAGAILATAAPLGGQAPGSAGAAQTAGAGEVMPDSVRAYLREAMAIFRERSVHRDTVDWEALEDSVLARAAAADTPRATWAALNWALRRVDRHSFLMPPRGATTAAGPAAPVSRRTAPPLPTGRLLPGGIAMVVVPAHGGPNRAEYVDSLHAQLAALDGAGVCGWVVDLRENTGGNMWPMLAGIGALLGGEVVGSFTDAAPGVAWRVRDGRSWLGDSAAPAVPAGWGSAAPRPLVNGAAPVALLVGRRTASSGEMTLVAFLGRPHVRAFGDSTSGYASANASVPLRDGATMIITASYPRDRLGRHYPLTIAPDELVSADGDGGGSGDDATLERAAAWLRGQRSCADRGAP